jgi:ribosome biogenesis GTPase
VGAGDGVDQAFQEVEELARSCSYTSCSHTGEQGCALALALSDGRLERGRMESWLGLRAEGVFSEHEAARRDVKERKRRKAAKIAERRARTR